MVAGILVLSACGDDGDDTEADDTTEEGAEAPVDITWVATARDDVDEVVVYAEPGGTDPTHNLPNPYQVDSQDPSIGSPTPFLLVDDADPAGEEWLHVHLPAPPNDSTGYIRAEDVNIGRNTFRITVDRDEMTLTLTQDGETVLEAPVGLGRDERATEAGDYFITQLIAAENPEGAYGPYAYGINGFPDDPEILAEFGEDATVGIHGTNEPESVGDSVSSGCIRMLNDDITDLVNQELPLGTPVEVI